MIIAPATDPPVARSMGTSPGSDAAKPALQDSTSHNIPAAPPSLSQKMQVLSENGGNKEGIAFLENLSVPTVILDAPVVTHTMAATLSLSLLGHTLFLKSQVPFPVAQLMRMPGGGSNAKVAKKREELLATFDTLSSHLRTTFVALSTAYAKCKLAKDKAADVPGDENSQKVSRASSSTNGTQRGSAHLMFILGPSVGAARARILLTIDGLEVKVWGERVDMTSHEDADEPGDEDSVDNDGTDEETEDSDDTEDEDSEEDSDETGSEESSEEEGELSESESDSASGPPASRSPSPDPPTRSLAPSPESPLVLLKPLSAFPEHPPNPPAASAPSTATATATPPPTTIRPSGPASRQTSPTPAPAPSYAEEQAALRAAERLLSRTLMTAWADGGGDMASELAPTQTHVYLRAPRRFAHPAWIARQNLSRTLDGVLDAHLLDAGARGSGDAGAKKKARGVKTEGAWIGCKGGSAFAAEQARKASEGTQDQDQKNETRDEEDEEIWWAWDGKIIGFADW
ncbi:hypothetical protein TRAPUB_12881 [Trametes pubescens]|uniref:Uncharacterized protein n=1 Tax=Trametes pubescens TaxID=154538 RepID=A0A1M2VSU1_TRAPU|nr:hypothetical protein TRAPUB_12881 [Trametes pubescens]